MSQRSKVVVLLMFFSVCAAAALVQSYKDSRPDRLRPRDLYEVVMQQLRACRADNYASAYSNVSSTFQQHWTLCQFSGMMRIGYARILDAERVEFGTFQQTGRHAVVEVFFVSRDGNVFPCIYSLISERDGWKIDGARWVKGWPPGRRIGGIRS